MKNNRFYESMLTRSEISWGIRYLLFQLLFLPSLISALGWILPIRFSSAQLNFLYFLINFLAVLIIFRKFLLAQLRLQLPDILRIAVCTVGFFALYRLSIHAVGWLLFQLDPELSNQNDQAIYTMSQRSYLLMFLGTVFLVPVAEECLYRGLIFRGLSQRSPLLAFAVSTAAFAAVHLVGNVSGLSPLQIVLCFCQYVPAGLCLAGAYRVSGSIFCPMAIHIAVNALGMLSMR